MSVSASLLSACCPRIGAPPLRFKGWCLARHQRAATTDMDLFLELWQRQRGGFTAAFSQWQDDRWQRNALTTDTLEGAIDAVEARCAGLRDVCVRACAPRLDDVHDLAVTTQTITDFLNLVGHALDDWDALSRAAVPAAPLGAQSG